MRMYPTAIQCSSPGIAASKASHTTAPGHRHLSWKVYPTQSPILFSTTKLKSTQISTVSSTPSATPLTESSNRMASTVSMSSTSASFPSGFFNNCNIQGGVQVFFGLQSRSDEQNWLYFSSILWHISRFLNRIWAFVVMFCSSKGEVLD